MIRFTGSLPFAPQAFPPSTRRIASSSRLGLLACLAALSLSAACTCSGAEVGEGGGDDAGEDAGVDGGRVLGDGGRCTPLTCAELGFDCGPAGDGCGGLLLCGTCTAPQTCGGGGTPSVCGGNAACVPGTCATANVGCGPAGDGCGGLLDCGTCAAPKSCGGGGVPSQCGAPSPCVPKTCAQLGFNCGPAGDGCGGPLQCGTCTSPAICGGSQRPSVCGDGRDGGITLADGGYCSNLCLKQVACDGGLSTTLTGTVYAPTDPSAGYGQPDPIYNALVYVPNAPVQPFDAGVSCDKCGALASGSPLVATQSGPDGTFTLRDVPVVGAGNTIPLVIQLGKWRRQVQVPAVAACTTQAVSPTLTRLPRNRNEGDIPKMAISTGDVDAIECVLRKMGIQDSEFTAPSGAGRVHMFRDNGTSMSAGSPAGSQLYGSAANLAKYDVVFFPCGGGNIPVNTSNWSGSTTQPPRATSSDAVPPGTADIQRLNAYANVGGRVFATHFSYAWLNTISPWSTTALWNPNQAYLSTEPSTVLPPYVIGHVNTTFPKGAAFSQWLSVVGAAKPSAGKIEIHESRHDNDGVPAGGPSTNWIDTDATSSPPGYAPTPVSTQHLTFNTPIGAAIPDQCGRVLFSDFHVNTARTSATTFPGGCSVSPLTDQEKVLEFMIFDLSSCIVPDVPKPYCVPRTCQQQGLNCGPAGDGCGNALSCGTCTAPQTCGGGGVPGVCGPVCTPKTCAQLGLSCGPAGDGCGGQLDCGACTAPETCGGGGTPGKCGKPSCTPRSCADQGFDCGPAGDGCGAQLDCGVCTPPAVCGGSGKPGVCSAVIN